MKNNPEYLEMVQKAENVVDVISTTFGIKVIDNLSEEELSEVSRNRFSTAANTFIEKGVLHAKSEVSPALILHELINILVVEEKYRHLMTRDTQVSYAEINKLEPVRKKFRSESSTLGLHYHISKHFGLRSRIFGGFFNGSILAFDMVTNQYVTDIPLGWQQKGEELFNELRIGDLSI